jgi:preprotein translocase subunit SecE
VSRPLRLLAGLLVAVAVAVASVLLWVVAALLGWGQGVPRSTREHLA